jgi:hypothetical protein
MTRYLMSVYGPAEYNEYGNYPRSWQPSTRPQATPPRSPTSPGGVISLGLIE